MFKSKLKVHHKIFLSFSTIALILGCMLFGSLFTFNTITSNFSTISNYAIPLSKSSTQLLGEKIEFTLLIHSIKSQTSQSSVEEVRQNISKASQIINEELSILRQYQDNFPSINTVLQGVNENFVSVSGYIDSLLGSQSNIIRLSQSLPEKLSEVQIALEDIRANMVLISEEADEDLSTESYSIVKGTEILSTEINRLYSSFNEQGTDARIENVIKNYEAMSTIINTLKSLPDLESEEGDLLLEGFDVITNNIKQETGLLKLLMAIRKSSTVLTENLQSAEKELKLLGNKILELNVTTQNELNKSKLEVESALGSGRSLNIVFSVISLLLFVVVGRWFYQSIEDPLHKFQAYVKTIEQGDLTEVMDIHSGDEFEDTGKTLQGVTERLGDIMKSIHDQAIQVENTSSYVVNSSQDLKVVLKQQTDEVNAVSSMVFDLERSSETVQGNVNNTHNQIDQVSSLSAEAAEDARLSISTIGELKNFLAQTMSGVEELVRCIHEIHGMTDMISSVADQTNLLALNAAIEAARAGDAGRGFAVVADEVRSLAVSTQDTTHVIRTQIEQIVTRSEKSKSLVDECNVLAEAALNRFESTAARMKKIDVALDEVSGLTSQVSKFAENQTEHTRTGAEKLQHIKQIGELNASTFESMSGIMSRLADLSKALNDEINFFEYHGKYDDPT